MGKRTDMGIFSGFVEARWYGGLFWRAIQDTHFDFPLLLFWLFHRPNSAERQLVITFLRGCKVGLSQGHC